MNPESTPPVYFASAAEFRQWLEKNHQTENELVVGYHKVHTRKPSMSWSESVNEAICFGWIDGIRKPVDGNRYTIRFTPRNPKSNWSAINIEKAEEMIRLGKMTPAGMKAYERRSEARSLVYRYENRPERFSEELEATFRENPEAWEFFSKQAPSYQKVMIFWVMSAKQEKTRYSRLEKLITTSRQGKRIM